MLHSRITTTPRIYHCFSCSIRVYSTKNVIKRHTIEASFIAAASSPGNIPRLHGLPEVIVTGRANCGKSSLLNAVLGRRSLLNTSKKAGRTRELNFFRVGVEPGKLIVVDAPGYGGRGRPEWGELFNHYVETRKELKRVYILFNSKHELNSYDIGMLSYLSEVVIRQRERFTLQAIVTKADCMRVEEAERKLIQIRKDIERTSAVCLPPIVTSTKLQPIFGIEDVRRNIAKACGVHAPLGL
ncbi:hypothetical protein AMATHDRAFT_137681 [Amanita thiersii Skay4041]|uniref:EngB-type G domain-containing protein n=1 Tax=Amanita thiersii Skay4041 TaxID=703135 RepID=A0A2A9NRP8_9AGAR|nr:hypothetical protein AMATHDRAFT_137681 [Amanita thiersii Skay4041]